MAKTLPPDSYCEGNAKIKEIPFLKELEKLLFKPTGIFYVII
jgi:hypothetical protein